jgi:hypothetical protein
MVLAYKAFTLGFADIALILEADVDIVVLNETCMAYDNLLTLKVK